MDFDTITTFALIVRIGATGPKVMVVFDLGGRKKLWKQLNFYLKITCFIDPSDRGRNKCVYADLPQYFLFLRIRHGKWGKYLS